MKKRFIALALAVVMLAGVVYLIPKQDKQALADTMTALPVSPNANPATVVYAMSYEYLNSYDILSGNFGNYQIQNKVPIYSIQQSNGYYSNYMKLRDIGYFMDFDVVWNENEPNAMRLYTKKHYLDPWTEPGPATETKAATVSNMDIYVDDVKVQTDVVPVMIEYNNYFKVRDIAKIMNFWCEFKPVTNSWGSVNNIYLDRSFIYVDEAGVANGAQREWESRKDAATNSRFPCGKYANEIQYETSAWYTGKIGQTETSPVTYTARDPWGNYDYTKLYFGKTDPTMNAMAQLLLDRNVIEQNHDGVEQFGDGNKLNRYYRYPLVEYKEDSYNPGQIVLPAFVNVSRGSNFGHNLFVNEIGIGGKVGVLSIKYDESSPVADSRVLVRKYAAPVFDKMDTYSCDAEKIMYLASVVCQKMVYSTDGPNSVDRTQKGIPSNIEIKGFQAGSTNEELAKVWSDNAIYAGACEDYSIMFENLCNAAGYYYVANTDHYNHIFDWVWVPDEGRWISVDCSAGSGRGGFSWVMRDTNGNWHEIIHSQGQPCEENDCSNSTAILDFFWLMEQLKPGDWLSTDYRLNP